MNGSNVPTRFVALLLSTITILLSCQFGWPVMREVMLFLGLTDWNLHEIEEELGVSVPESASQIRYASSRPKRTFFIELSFVAPPDDAYSFITNFCDGNLQENYNPFDSSNTYFPRVGSFLVNLHQSIWYSYSDDKYIGDLGGFCQNKGKDNWVVLVHLDRSHPDRHRVTLEVSPAQLPFVQGHQGSAFVNPTREFPFGIAGLLATEQGYFLAANELCFESSFTPNTLPNETYDSFIGSQITIEVDGNLVSTGEISSSWLIADDGENIHEPFANCYTTEWTEGDHIIDVDLVAPSGTQQNYTWEFQVTED